MFTPLLISVFIGFFLQLSLTLSLETSQLFSPYRSAYPRLFRARFRPFGRPFSTLMPSVDQSIFSRASFSCVSPQFSAVVGHAHPASLCIIVPVEGPFQTFLLVVTRRCHGESTNLAVVTDGK